jgi:hypothetical protein
MRYSQQPFDSPLLGPKPLPKQRKRRSPFWRVTPGSAFAEKYYVIQQSRRC